MTLIAATLFSGIGAPEVACPHWRWAWCAEIEPFPSAVLAVRHPHSVNLGDVTAHDFAERAAAIGRPDVLVFGSPCQDFSVAGKRVGMAGARANLALVALGIVGRLRPPWFVFENVPGLLSNWSGAEDGSAEAGAEWESVESADFAAFLGCVDELGYSGAWASLDAQWFGVAQRRERLFFVGYLGENWRPSAAVLLEPESLCGDSPPGREAREEASICPPLCAGGNRAGGRRPLGTAIDDAESLIPFDTTQVTSKTNRCQPSAGDPCHPLAAAAHPPAVAYGFEERARGDDGRGYDREPNFMPDCAPALQTVKPASVAFCIVPDAVDRSGEGAGGTRGERAGLNIVEECQPALRARANNSVAVAFGGNNTSGPIDVATCRIAHTGGVGRLDFESETFVVSHPLRADDYDASEDGTGRGTPIVAVALRGRDGGATAELSDIPSALRASQGGGDKPYVLTSAVRRLTPRECEALQGFPRDFTAITYRGKPAADGPRYRALGNSMCVPVMRWILTRIEHVDGLVAREAESASAPASPLQAAE